jgi:hypothetical protein
LDNSIFVREPKGRFFCKQSANPAFPSEVSEFEARFGKIIGLPLQSGGSQFILARRAVSLPSPG